jgi:hypothetical protein
LGGSPEKGVVLMAHPTTTSTGSSRKKEVLLQTRPSQTTGKPETDSGKAQSDWQLTTNKTLRQLTTERELSEDQEVKRSERQLKTTLGATEADMAIDNQSAHQ